MINIGEKIKELRKARGLTQQELANKASITRVSLGNYERGDRIPDVYIAIRIAKAFEITMNELCYIE